MCCLDLMAMISCKEGMEMIPSLLVKATMRLQEAPEMTSYELMMTAQHASMTWMEDRVMTGFVAGLEMMTS